MSADDDGGPGEREVAHRLFAAEFEDASLEYAESDEERAPNYVVTPTGARVNRLFVAGVLTEVETVNENTLRGRVVDPTGAFVTYAGQYQPEEVAFLDRTRPPAFVSLTGKGRTFQPEDSDVVYSSVRPERLSEVDADTRDAWVVDAAEATLRRVAVVAAAREVDARGDTLHDRLVDAGVDESLATGVTLALDHYGTTASYLESLRTVATEALAVVADERDEVSATTSAPDADEGVTVGPLPERVRLAVGDDETTEVTEAGDGTDTTDGVTVTGNADGDTDSESVAGVEASVTTDAEADDTEAVETGLGGSEPVVSTDETAVDAAPTTDATGDASSTDDTEAGSTVDTDDLGGFGDTETSDTTVDDTPADDLGGFDDTGVTESAETSVESDTEELGGFDTGDDEEVSLDEDSLDDALSDEERETVRSEHGVGFSSGTEVPDPEESELDAPDPEEITPTPETGGDTTADEGSSAPVETESPDSADSSAPTGAAETATDTGDADGATSVDLETAVVEIMDELNDGDGADRERVMAVAVDRHGADPGAAEEAIQGALMSGQCYEAGGGLKPI
ncbi:MAG: uncharacterized protein conserved in archaea [halophilic archaeon J07HB67]|nr:MAG: uncharacterized protein conserved in archaea [halophilic archaeon J07HB67]